MSDEYREDLTSGVEIGYAAQPGKELKLTVYHDGEPVHANTHPAKILTSSTLKGQFVNRTEEALEDRPVAEDTIASELRQWFAKMSDVQQEQKKKLLTDEVRRIIDGTEKVEVYAGDPTTWVVTLTYDGDIRELEFTTGEILTDSPGPLREAIANNFFEIVDIEDDDWAEIRQRWDEQKEIAQRDAETGLEAVATRVLDRMSEARQPVDEKAKLGNSPEAVWYDDENDGGLTDVGGPVAWVHDTFFVDKIDSTGQSIQKKGDITRVLNQNDVLLDVRKRRRWPNPQGRDRAQFYPFDPDALAIDPAVFEVDDADETGGVDP